MVKIFKLIGNGLFLFVISEQGYAKDNIIVNSQSSPNTYITKNKNNIDIININKADEYYISHNYFDAFNVSEEGVIINNEKEKAKLIINEVVSNEKSYLNGNVSIAGQEAKLVIANPNGIECNNCGFTGAENITLLVGKSNLSEDFQFNLTDNQLVIKGLIGAGDAKQINFIGNAIDFNGAMYIDNAKFIVGYDNVDYIDYVWSGLNKNDGMLNISPKAKLMSQYFEAVGGTINLNGLIKTTKIKIIKNKEFNINEGGRLALFNSNANVRFHNDTQYIESDSFNFLGRFKIENSNIIFNVNNAHFNSKVKSHFINSGVLINSKDKNNFSGDFFLKSSNVVFTGNKQAYYSNGRYLGHNLDTQTVKNELTLNDIYFDKIQFIGKGNISVMGNNIHSSDSTFKIRDSKSVVNNAEINGKVYLMADNILDIKYKEDLQEGGFLLKNKNNLVINAKQVVVNGVVEYPIVKK